MQQETIFSPVIHRLAELKTDEQGQVMPFTAVFSLFLIVCWLTVYNVGVGVTDKVRLQDMADQVAYSQAIVGARAMNLIALNNRTMVANLVSYTTSVIMRSHSKFIRDLTLVVYTIMYILSTLLGEVPIVGWIIKALAVFAYLIDFAANGYDFVTFGLALVWRFILNIQIVWILIPASKLMFTAFAAMPVLNIAEYQGAAIFRELSNEETATLPSGETDLWTQFGGVQLVTGSLTDLLGDSGGGAFSLEGTGLNIAALGMQILSWSSWDNLIELPGGPNVTNSSNGGFEIGFGGGFGSGFGSGSSGGSSASNKTFYPDKFLNFLNLESTPSEKNGSAFTFQNTNSTISQERRIQWMVSRTYPLSDRDQPLFGVSGVGGDAGGDTLSQINSKRQRAFNLEMMASNLDNQAQTLEEEAETLRNGNPPDDEAAAEKEAEAAEKRSQANAKRSEAEILNGEANELENSMTSSDPEDFNIDWNGSVDEPRWGFNRDPLGPLGGMGLGSGGIIVGYAIFANAYCLVVHGSPARVEMTFGGETRVGRYTNYGTTTRIEKILGGVGINVPGFDIYTMKGFESGWFEEVPDYSKQYEIVGYDFFEVEVEYIDWDIWPSWEREDDISLDFGDAAFSSKLELPVLHGLTDYSPALPALYESAVDNLPGFNGNFPNIWRGLFHEQNSEYNDFYTGLSFISQINQFTSKAGIDFSPQGFLEVDEKHFAEKYLSMFNQKYHYEIQKTGSNEIERRKGKYYVMLGREYKTMRLLRWLGLLDSGGDLLEGVELDGHKGTGVVFNGNSKREPIDGVEFNENEGYIFAHDSQGGDDSHYGNYDEAATVAVSREFNPHFFNHMVVLSKSEVFYERPSYGPGEHPKGWGELPNLMNAFWSARLAPLQTDVSDFIAKLGIGADLAQAFTFALTH